MYEYTKFFVGKDYLVPQWRVEEGLLYNGNSILLQLQEYRYVYIGDSVYEFSVVDNDVIVGKKLCFIP